MEKGNLSEIHFSIDVVKVDPRFRQSLRQDLRIFLHFIQSLRTFDLIPFFGVRMTICKRQMVKIHIKEIKLCLFVRICAIRCNKHRFCFSIKSKNFIILQFIPRFIDHVLFCDNSTFYVFIRPLSILHIVVIF